MGKWNIGPASSGEPRAEDLIGNVERDEFVDAGRDRRVFTSSSGQNEEDDGYQGDALPKGWFSWRK